MAVEFSGEYRIPAPQARVWAALNDASVLQASIAGCKQLDKLSDTEFSAIVVAKVGPISATFRGSVELSEIDAPHSYTLTGRGQGGAAGFAKMTARVALRSSSMRCWMTCVSSRFSASARVASRAGRCAWSDSCTERAMRLNAWLISRPSRPFNSGSRASYAPCSMRRSPCTTSRSGRRARPTSA